VQHRRACRLRCPDVAQRLTWGAGRISGGRDDVATTLTSSVAYICCLRAGAELRLVAARVGRGGTGGSRAAQAGQRKEERVGMEAWLRPGEGRGAAHAARLGAASAF